ncbi:MAG: glutaminase [Acidobacteriota bacterium]|nr:glutaminase [Acidobacteriota bacterium]
MSKKTMGKPAELKPIKSEAQKMPAKKSTPAPDKTAVVPSNADSQPKPNSLPVRQLDISIDEGYLEELIIDAKFNCRSGDVAHYIPELRMALDYKTGISTHLTDRRQYRAGDCNRYLRGAKGEIGEEERPKDDSFTIQSISKVLALLYVLKERGADQVFKRMGKEPTGDAFNAEPRVKSVGGLHMPYNPLINVGAILITSLFPGTKEGDPQTFPRFLKFVEKLCRSTQSLIVDEAVYLSERRTGHGNRALAWRMSADGIFHQEITHKRDHGLHDELSDDEIEIHRDAKIEEVDFVERVLNNYFRQCSILVTTELLATAACTLANGGTDPFTGEQIINDDDVRTAVTLMSSCGMYDGSGQFAHDVGMPAKSGVGGGIFCVVPGVAGIATFAPPLDEKGNSVRGLYMLGNLSKKYDLSLFHKEYMTPSLVSFKGNADLEKLTNEVKNLSPPPEEYKKADYIPELSSYKAINTGMSICFQGKDRAATFVQGGDCTEKFTLQSISTLFGLIYALNMQGEGRVFQYVGKEPSGEPFDHLKWKRYEDSNVLRLVPFNPMINAGAILIAAMIPKYYGSDDKKIPDEWPEKLRKKGINPPELLDIDDFLEFVKSLCGNPYIDINWQVYESERRTGFKNRSLAWSMNDEGVFFDLLRRHNRPVDAEVIEDILSVYFRMCSIEVTCKDLAHAGAVLANNGQKFDGEYLAPPRHVTIATSMMTSSGMFDGSGEFAYRTGIPAKSGISGGILAVVPGKMGIGVYSPVPDEKGNSYCGQELLARFANDEHLSIFTGPLEEAPKG